MVGFDPNRVEKGLTASQCGICGSIAGAFTRIIVQPLDVVKIRFQLHMKHCDESVVIVYTSVEPTFGVPHNRVSKQVIANIVCEKSKPTGKYTGVGQAFKLVYTEEGITALWKGHVPAQILSVAYGYFQFTFFEVFTKAAYYISPKTMEHNYIPVLVNGIVLQVYSGLMQAARMMYTIEGPTSFYKGLIPSLLQIFPYAGLQFGSYTLLKMIWDYAFEIKKHNPYMPADILKSLVCGGVSGMLSKGLLFPLDIVKKRIQVQGFGVARATFGRVPEYNGLVDCVQSILKYEGIAGLYKGIVPSTIKVSNSLIHSNSAAMSLSITFCTYEQCLHFMRHLVHDDMEDHVKDIASS
ncbi:hypothetical protein QZH41_011184 [Actinostola sp. cb2023]|nr:hypothetical protein QZH41_011184 [Actinostola sp. cb2023]